MLDLTPAILIDRGYEFDCDREINEFDDVRVLNITYTKNNVTLKNGTAPFEVSGSGIEIETIEELEKVEKEFNNSKL